MPPPLSVQKNKLCLLIASYWFLVWAYLSTLKMEAIWSSEMSVDCQWTTQHYVPEDRPVQ
jgi:hypothetical protein